MYTNRNRHRCCRTLSVVSNATAANMITAGEACMSDCTNTGLMAGMNQRLAQVESPIQEYQTGFCPCTALQKGTFFPELVQ